MTYNLKMNGYILKLDAAPLDMCEQAGQPSSSVQKRVWCIGIKAKQLSEASTYGQ